MENNSILNMTSHEQEQLQQLFKEFKTNPFHRLNVKIRRWRSAQLRRLLSEPENITLDIFNKQVWAFLTQAKLDGEPFELKKFFDQHTASPDELHTVEKAVDENRLKVEGNFIWGSGSAIYGSQISLNDAQKLQQIQMAIGILAQENAKPLDIARQLEAIEGFGWNIATALTMVFHWHSFAIYNTKSQGALSLLGLPCQSIEDFQHSAKELQQLLGAQDFLELDLFLYLINEKQIPWPVVPPITESTRFWKISPGENAFLWDKWKNNGYIAIGWPEMGDARTATPEEFKVRQLTIVTQPDKYEDARRYTPDSVKQLWQFAHDIKPGDRIVANKGTSQVLGIGIVTGNCTFEPDDEGYLHRLPVQWIDLTPKAVVQGGWRSTLIELTREKFEAIARQNTDVIQETATMQEEAIATAPQLQYPLNQILYGPPGTGKTYNSIIRAVEIITSRRLGHAEAKIAFDELRRQGRIGFVTFHQSFGYEDFIEGIRPVVTDSSGQQARYEIRDGIFKKMASLAIAASIKHKAPADHSGPTFDQLWDDFTERIEAEAAYEIDGIKSSRYRLWLSPRGNIYGENVQGNAQEPYNASRINIEKVWRQLPADETPTHNKLHAIIGKGSHTNLIGAVVLELRRLAGAWAPSETTSDEQRPISETDIQAHLEGSPDFDKVAAPPRFVLIADEINRGNISKILGELITLLEEDKRLGADNELIATLPYSGEAFAVPANLYLLGTMNTADKSLALLDIALRRRFQFEEYAPDFSYCQQLSDEAKAVLEEMNRRIVLSKDRDHRIGHSFFMKVVTIEEFNTVFREAIIPLLQEYFYNDWEGLRFVLGEEGGDGKFICSLGANYKHGVRNRWQWYFDAGKTTDFDCLAVLRANYAATALAPTQNA